jgi:hypothetical protein
MSVQLLSTPTTLADLQAMSGDEIRRIDSLQRSEDEPPIFISKFFRLVIRLAAKEQWSERRSVREFWYNPVKPLAQKTFTEHSNDPSRIDGSFNDYFAGVTSHYLSELVLDGEIAYRDLNIYDESRERSIKPSGFEDDKILFVEKEAAYRKIDPLADVYDLSIVSGGGFGATAAIEDIAGVLSPTRSYKLFVVSDYDPAGFKIIDDFERRAGQLGINLLTAERVGIDPDQLDDQTVQEQRFRPSYESNYDLRWRERYAINGEYGLEIEAVSGGTDGGRMIRQAIVDELRPHIKENIRIEDELADATQSMVEGAKWDAVGEIIDIINGDLRERLHEQVDPEVDRIVSEAEAVTFSDGTHNIDPMKARQHVDAVVPEPPEVGELHEKAVSGDSFDVSYRKERDAIKNQIMKLYENGEIEAY